MARDILIVDDEADIRQLIAGILEDEGYEARVAGDSTEVLRALATRRPSLVVLDIWLQGSEWDGLQLLDHLNQEHADVPVVIISGHGNVETAVAAIKRGAYDYIEKPFKADRLLVIVQRAIQAARLERENRELKQRAIHETEFIGKCAAIGVVRAAIDKVAGTGSRVLITGPAGSGKEVAARRLHALSSRGEGPFVVLNAAMLEPQSVEIELFGEEGRGNGGSGRRVGLFEQAHGGTLFLDEVADMPLETQGKILRVLVDQNFQRVGGGGKVQVDVRVISSSTRDLRQEIARKGFREDLYHRLNVVPIQIPSLGERREDIPQLVGYFMQRSAEMLGLALRKVGPDALSALQGYEWPGNVRQLRNIIERLLIMVPGEDDDVIRVDMLPPEINAPTTASLMPDNSAEIMSMSLREAREVFERQYLMAQVGRFGGNISRTAEFVGMERSALHRKLKTLGVHQRGPGEVVTTGALDVAEA